MFEFSASNLVVTAKALNPSVFTQLWLVRQNIVQESDLLPTSVVTDEATQLETHSFMFVALPERIQLLAKSPEAERATTEAAKAILAATPLNEYTAVGLNITCLMAPSDGTSMHSLSKRLFLNKDSPAARMFDSDNAHFGGYVSQDFEEFRLRLDVKPIAAKLLDGTTRHAFKFDFNFHRELPVGPDAVRKASAAVERWSKCRSQVLTVMKAYDEYQGAGQ